MKFYSLDSKFTFGKYSDNTIAEVLILDKAYVEWCLINLNHFVIDDDVIEEVQSHNPSFQLSKESDEARVAKLDEYYEEQASYDEEDFEDPEDDYGSSGEKYGWYNGFSDDAIDDAFEGDPMNTWNVD
ncbi:MAG: hypothetical protein CFE25_05635 [Chitinophagaceae bacterium BSSC1]|nr:MAG: hypothetical protein CFE25_05635 [Chitinophagaceae bacterium BSSC1]